MPLYESVMQEKPPIVLDIGNAYTKLGFAAEAYPRLIIPTELVLTTTGETKQLFDYVETDQLYDQLVDFLQTIFFKHLLVSPKERKFVLVENIFGQTVIRETLARALFMHFDVSSVLFVPSHLTALSTLAVNTGLVVDIGYSETTVMPVFSGVQIMSAFKDHSFGSRAVHAEIKRQLLATGVKEALLTEPVLEDIKIRTCFVTSLERAQAKEPLEPPPSVAYAICDDDAVIQIPGTLRESVYELLFEQSNERDSLPHLVLRAILDCNRDVRRALIESIFVIGGGSMVQGLLARLKSELQLLLASDKYYAERFHGELQFKFYHSIGKQNFTAWLGGALCGATDLIQSRSLSKEAYLRHEHVPDWSNLCDNRLNGN
ncbi:actin-related protein 10 [Drosophila sulfurigaster albostrigata]|uniref:actin-related protein 10 n=1 Tax=Drosophila sulfurigaster albostrigata TaxID=89887 RepID=UPI002D21E890|nr:actin-related protein 10 [Drosophila sulfurigaster albostrigata]